MTARARLRVVHIGNLARRDSGEFAVLKNYAAFYNELATELAKDGAHVHVFAPVIGADATGYGFLNEHTIDARIQLTTTPGNTPDSSLPQFIRNNCLLVARVARFCLTRDNVFVFLPSFPGAIAIAAVLAARRCSTLGLYIGGDFAAEQRHEQRRGLAKRWIKRIGAQFISRAVDAAIRRADYGLTASREYYQRFAKTARILIAPTLLNVDETDLEANQSRAVDETGPFLFCGELRHAKGVMTLLEAFALLRKRHPGACMRLRIIGSGHAEQEMREFTLRHEIADAVEFCGQISVAAELVRLLQQSSALVLPSFSEGFPRVAYECFALGVPAILTPVGGIPYTVRDREHCLIVPPGDASELAEAMWLVRTDAGLRTQLVENSRQLMRDDVFARTRRYGTLARMVARGTRGDLAAELERDAAR